MEQDATNHLAGTTHGPVVQAHTIQGDVHLHVGTNSEDIAVPETPPPSGWDNLPALPSEVRSLLEAQIQAGKDLPYQLPGARRPSLDTVYVRQDLGTGVEEPTSEQQQRPTPILDSRGQLIEAPTGPLMRVTVRPPARTVTAALDDTQYLLVTGGPGQGKSTLSLRLAATVAEHWFATEPGVVPLTEPVVPLRLTARELATRLNQPFPEALANSAAAEYNRLLAIPPAARVLRERVAGCRWLLLIDGLDEIASAADRDQLVTALAGWATKEGSPYRFVLTTRPIEGAALAPLQRIGAARYELQPFNDKALRRFADHWFEDADIGYRFVRQIRAAHLDELVRVPLLATIAAIIFETHGPRPLPDNRYELYESYLLYLRSAHEPAPSRFDDLSDALLEHLARVRVEHDTSLVTAAQDWVSTRMPNLTGTWQDNLVAHLRGIGLFKWRADDLRFIHHSFAEHLAATAEARLLPEEFTPEAPEFSRLLHAARPDERGQHARAVLLHHTRLHTLQADRLITWLHAGDAAQHLLAARLLASHTPASAKVVDKFLVTVRAWAMTTQYSAGEILEQASRTVHHAGLASWLASLLDDEKAPWKSRIEAASALATRLRGTDSPAATTLLRTVVDNSDIPVRHRLAAAEALSDCGAEERQHSARGLRAVLADPDANGWSCRVAAVVLAGLDDTSRKHAADALNSMVNDPWMPDNDLVDIASGLTEIGVEFHNRCAEIFHTILERSTRFSTRLDDIALGLASLGPEHLTAAAKALTTRGTDRRRDRRVRLRAIAALAELGPQHRLAAADHAVSIAREPDVEPHESWSIANEFTRIGLHEHAEKLLCTALDLHDLNPNNRMWTARELKRLGPEHRDRAAQEFWHVVNNPRSSEYDRATALAELTTTGESDRLKAIAALRSVVSDRNSAASFRCRVATELVRLGPEFHDEVIEYILELTTTCATPGTQAMAWYLLRDLGADIGRQARHELSELLTPESAELWASHRDTWEQSHYSTTENADHVIPALEDTLHRPSEPGEVRLNSASALIGLGRRFHVYAHSGLLALLQSQSIPANRLTFFSSYVARLSATRQEEISANLLEIAQRPHTSPSTLCAVAEALAETAHQSMTTVVAELRSIVADNAVAADDRAEAALALVCFDDNELLAATEIALRTRGQWPEAWARRAKRLATLGADVTPHLHSVLTDTSARVDWRIEAGAALGRVCPGLRTQIVAALENQGDDEHLEFVLRSYAKVRLVRVDPATRPGAVAYHLSALDDLHRPVVERCESAYEVAKLDNPSTARVMATLRGFASDSRFTITERWASFRRYASLRAAGSEDANQLGLTLARDPAAPAFVRRGLCRWLSGRARLEVERSLLADRAASPSERVGDLNTWEHHVLGTQAETILRDVLQAAESTPAERVDAAGTLGDIAPQHVSEAVRVLNELATDERVTRRAFARLAKLSLSERRRIIADASSVVADEKRSWRARCSAAALVCELASSPTEHVADYVRQLVNDPRIAAAERVQILSERGEVDLLRGIRDDESLPPAIRWQGATELREFDTTDRVTGARILSTIATDATNRPALRWRVARDLTRFGERGRAMGAAALETIVSDETLPMAVRAKAADTLASARPDRRLEMTRTLRRLTTDNPRTRLHILQAIGRFDPLEGALALSDMAEDKALAAGVRLRASVAMAELRRDFQDRAAVTAHEVAFDETCPWHIRLKAARQLARWSDPCRAQAQVLIRHLTEAVRWTRSRPADEPSSGTSAHSSAAST